MRIALTRPLFDWEALEHSSSVQAIRALVESIPDGALLASLDRARGRGRDDYPVHVLWGVVLLTIALRHKSFEDCLAELHRNRHLREVIGVESESKIPKKWNISRFLQVLGREPHLTLLREVFNSMAKRLGECVPELGKRTAGDATTLNARATRDKTELANEQQQGLAQPSGGRKEYLDEAGNVSKVIKWFGFKLHLVVDVKHEVALAYEITATSKGDGETLPQILAQAQRNLPPDRIESLAYDKAADTNDVHEALKNAKVKAVIQNRKLWKEESERMLQGHDGRSNVVYDEAGTVHCYDKVSTPMVRHAMAYTGFEKDRGTLKYRCPAVHGGWSCPSASICNAGRSYGMTVRVPQEVDLRRFPDIPRATQQFERLYKGRTAVERVNARLKIFWGADDGNINGSGRFHAHVGAVMVVHLAFATLLASAPRYEGSLGKTRITPIAKALQARIRA